MFHKTFFNVLLTLLLFAACSGKPSDAEVDTGKPEEPDNEISAYPAARLTARYSTGEFAFESEYPEYRDDRFVGIFYFIWIGAHGYDVHSDHNEVQVPAATDIKSPYDINELLKADPGNPAYGPAGAFHHWGKPYLDYYVSNDRWVIRKHAQMLADAGIDVIFLDVTNGYHYLPTVKILCEEYTAMRAEGNRTPQIAFLLNSDPVRTLNTIYREFYESGLYPDLWFKWNGKPLILCPDDPGLPDEQKAFFIRRHSWFDSRQSWFGDGSNKWTWGDYYPQNYGKSSASSKEQMSILPATHPTSNIGRSHDGQSQPPNVTSEQSAEGVYFKLQMKRALEANPQIVFITGWNEWVAMRFTDGAAGSFLGKPIVSGDSYFVDQYNHEYSRDIEPVEGGFGDNYYYYMTDFVRKYKGVKPVEADGEVHDMEMGGGFGDWESVKSVFTDDKGDVVNRNHYGYGRVGTLTNSTGRNDIVETRVAAGDQNIYFYVKTASDISPYTDSRWMRLFLDVKRNDSDGDSSWEGFGYVVNNTVNSSNSTVLERSTGGWNWEKVRDVSYSAAGNEMELTIPLSALGISGSSGYSIDFKWIDNAVESGDIKECMRDGDSAPNGRFRFRYNR
ncbi:MAG: hypothetical protein LBJ72_07385 [Dysgonamonadaceae bacterium]|jgi:hypothetical protein|nr:hypothetical protein [Dysgonamonadaceae bacterium]